MNSNQFIHQIIVNPFTPTDHFRSIQNNEWKSPLKLLSVESPWVKSQYMTISIHNLKINTQYQSIRL